MDDKSGIWLRKTEGILVWNIRDPLAGRSQE